MTTPNQQPDAWTFAETVEKNRGAMIRVAYRVTRSMDDAEDVFQEAVLKALGGLPGFRQQSRPETWLYAIVRNTAYNWIRSCRGRKLQQIPLVDSELTLHQIRDPCRSPEQNCEFRELETLLLGILQTLEPRQRIVIEMCVLGDFSYQEAASTLSISLATLKARVFHGRAMLARDLRRAVEVRRQNDSGSEYRRLF